MSESHVPPGWNDRHREQHQSFFELPTQLEQDEDLKSLLEEKFVTMMDDYNRERSRLIQKKMQEDR